MLSVDVMSSIYTNYHFVNCYAEGRCAECVSSQHNDLQRKKISMTLSTKRRDAQC
jgi:hypothetical protein